MADALEWRARRNRAPGDSYMPEAPSASHGVATVSQHQLDSDEARKTHRQLLRWYYYERDRQAANRLEMAIDHDFYDSLQWDEEDAAIVTERGQAPLVYNEVAPMCDWIIGTERRNRVDWKVLPRTEDDVQLADTKTKALKYVSDVNRVVFARSRAFADSIKGGLGWMDDGARDDPTKDVIYSKYEDWRCVLHDSSATSLDDEDDRYRFRWRWVDEDIACYMFPDRKDKILTAVEDYNGHDDPLVDEDTWTTPYDGAGYPGRSGTLYAVPTGYAEDAQRRRVKLIECQFRMPVQTKVIVSGPLKGQFFHEKDVALRDALGRAGGSVIDKVMMRMHVAVFTEAALLGLGPSVYRHNGFSLTPIWAYRRNRDRMPYGVIRRVRDIQKDLNKRASKALWLMNTNQVIVDDMAAEDIETIRDEAQRPDGVLIKKQGKELTLRRDTDAATGQMQIMAMDAQSIQRSAGVTDENRGIKTNAISGEAIRARQQQGAVVTTELFDNLRLAVQVQGSKQLSLVEQFYTEEKVIRLTGAKGALEWVRINVPELQADGSYRFLNDITASAADFIVAEADYAGTLRQVMFEAMQAIAAKMPDPAMALRFLTIAFDFSDLPNKDEISAELRRLTGDRDPSKPMTPEEEQQAQAQAAEQAEALEQQKQLAMATLAEAQAKARELNAKAMKLEAEIEALAAGGGDNGAALEAQHQMKLEQAVGEVQKAASDQIERLSQQLAKQTADQTTAVLKINKEADTKAAIARIQADATTRAAELQAASDKKFDALMQRIEKLGDVIEDLRDDTKREVLDVKKVAEEAAAAVEALEKEEKAEQATAPAPAPAAEPAPAPTPTPAAEAPAAAPAPAKGISFNYAAGELASVTVTREDGSTNDIPVTRKGLT